MKRVAPIAALAMGIFFQGVAALVAVAGGRKSVTSSPVEKVVQLLEELKARVTKDGETEQALYDKFACWCEEITSKKAQTIQGVKEELRTLGNKILELKGTIVTKISEINEDMYAIEQNEKQQQLATSVRTKESTAFFKEKTELQEALHALEKATTILSAAEPAAMALGQKAEHVGKVLLEVYDAVGKLSPKAKPSKQQIAALSKAAHTKNSYTPQSATIQGILQDMYRSFSNTLQTRVKDEASAHRNYEDLMATWQTELLTLQEQVAKSEKAKAEAEMMLSDAETTYADLEAQLPKDIAFFDATVSSCTDKTQEWADRKRLRESETEGITQALDVLNSDEARQLFDKAIQPGYQAFLQVRAIDIHPAAATARKAMSVPSKLHTPTKVALTRASEVLVKRANQTKSARLAGLAASMLRAGAVGHFDKVIEAIDTLIASVKAEQTADDKKSLDCKDEYHSLGLAISDLEWKIRTNEAQLEKLDIFKQEKEAEETKTLEALQEVGQTIAELGSTRDQENADFLAAKEDDLKAIGLLEQAVNALGAYYANHTEASFAEEGRDLTSTLNVSEVPPDATFSEKTHRKTEAKGIVGLLENLIGDLHGEITAGMRAEEKAQLAYEAQLKAAQELQGSLNATKINLEETLALTGEQITQEEQAKDTNEAEHGTQTKTKEDITPACDAIINGLEDRREKRVTEVDGLRSAKELLAGARPPVLAQKTGSTASASSSSDLSDGLSPSNLRAVSLLVR